MAYAVGVTITVALAYKSGSKTHTYLACLVAGSWLVGMVVFLYEAYSGKNLEGLYTVIDGVVAGLIAWRIVKPKFDHLVVYLVVFGLLLTQALYRFAFTEISVAFWVEFGINRLFEVILIVINAYSLIRIRYASGKSFPVDFFLGKPSKNDRMKQQAHTQNRANGRPEAQLSNVIHAEFSDSKNAPVSAENSNAVALDEVNVPRNKASFRGLMRQLFIDLEVDD